MTLYWLTATTVALAGFTGFLVHERFKAERKMRILLLGMEIQQTQSRILAQALVDQGLVKTMVEMPGPIYMPLNESTSTSTQKLLQEIGRPMQKSGGSNTDSPTSKQYKKE